MRKNYEKRKSSFSLLFLDSDLIGCFCIFNTFKYFDQFRLINIGTDQKFIPIFHPCQNIGILFRMGQINHRMIQYFKLPNNYEITINHMRFSCMWFAPVGYQCFTIFNQNFTVFSGGHIACDGISLRKIRKLFICYFCSALLTLRLLIESKCKILIIPDNNCIKNVFS